MPNHITDFEGTMNPRDFSPIGEIDHNAINDLKLTLEDVRKINPLIDIKYFRIQEWTSPKDYEEEPRSILFIDEKGDGFRLGYRATPMCGVQFKWYYTNIQNYRVTYWRGDFSFETLHGLREKVN